MSVDIPKNRSFSIIELVIITAVLLLLAFVGWEVYDANRDKQARENLKPRPSQMKDGFVIIKEWGVRFKPDESLGEIMYFKPQGSTEDEFAFNSSKLIELNKDCADEVRFTPLGTISRDLKQNEAKQLVKIDSDNYRYYYHHRAGKICTRTPQSNFTGEQLTQKLIESFRETTEILPSLLPESVTNTNHPDGYLHIKEWGLRIPLTPEIADAVYHYEKHESGAESVGLSTGSLIEKSHSGNSDCRPRRGVGPLGAISKSISRHPHAGRVILEAPNGTFRLSGPQSACGPQELWSEQSQKLNIMMAAARKIELDQ